MIMFLSLLVACYKMKFSGPRYPQDITLFFFPLNKAKPSCVPHHIKLPGFFPIFPVSLILRVKSQPGTKLSSSELCSYRSNITCLDYSLAENIMTKYERAHGPPETMG